MKICIDMGHTPTSTGAIGYLNELSEDREIGKRVIAELQRRGHTVYNSTPADSVAYPSEINQRVNYANARSLDLFCSIHLNAGGGTGTEVLYFAGDNTGRSYASRISAKVANALGLPNRGAKANNWVGVICNTYATAVLIEVCFVDRYEDFVAYCDASMDELVKAICNGIDGTDSDVASYTQSSAKPTTPSYEPTGGEIRYAVSIDPNGEEWLPDMLNYIDTGGSSDDYAGNGNPIYWIAIDCPAGYQVKTKNGWLDKVYKYDPNDLVNGCAGDGTKISALRIYDNDVTYAVANVGCVFLPYMKGLQDTGGSSDDFAGNGGTIAKVKITR